MFTEWPHSGGKPVKTEKGTLTCLFSCFFSFHGFYKITVIFFVSGFLSACMSVHHVYAHTDQKRAWVALEQMVVGCHMGVEDQTQVLWNCTQCF